MVSLNRDYRNEPLYVQVRESLRKQIEEGELKPGNQIPPEVELARRFGLSRTTVRNAILDLVHDGLLYRVSGKGTFVRRPAADSFEAVVLLCPFLKWYMPEFIAGVEEVVRAAGLELIIRNAQNDAQVEMEQLKSLLGSQISGIIFWPKSPEFFKGSARDALDAIGPSRVVVVDQKVSFCDYVTADNFGGAYVACEHLVSCGARKVGFVSTHMVRGSSVHERRAGYEEALRNLGLWGGESLVYPRWPEESGFREWFKATEPDALFCANDVIAIEVTGWLQRQGYQIGSDIRIVGFDDISVAQSFNPPLTTVRQRFEHVGRSAARLLLSRLEHPDRPLRHLCLPVELVVRRSSTG